MCGLNWQETISRGITKDMDQILCTMLVLVLLGEHKNVFVCFNLLLREHVPQSSRSSVTTVYSNRPTLLVELVIVLYFLFSRLFCSDLP